MHNGEAAGTRGMQLEADLAAAGAWLEQQDDNDGGGGAVAPGARLLAEQDEQMGNMSEEEEGEVDSDGVNQVDKEEAADYLTAYNDEENDDDDAL